jgi:hypothetical protein
MAHTPGISCLEQYVECLDQGIALFVQATGDRTEPTMKTYEAQALAVPRNLLITSSGSSDGLVGVDLDRPELGARPAAHHPHCCGNQNCADDRANQAARTQAEPVARDQTREQAANERPHKTGHEG